MTKRDGFLAELREAGARGPSFRLSNSEGEAVTR